jgi:hypothetical protein
VNTYLRGLDQLKLRMTPSANSVKTNPVIVGLEVSKTIAEVYTNAQVLPAASAKDIFAVKGPSGYNEVIFRV